MIFKFSWFGQNLGQDWINTSYYDIAEEDPTDCQPYVDWVAEGPLTELAFYLTSEWHADGCRVHNVTTGEPVGVDYTFTNGNIVGDSASTPLAPIVAMVVKWKAASLTYPVHARNFITGWTEDRNIVTGRPDATALLGGLEFAQGMLTLTPDGVPSAQRYAVKLDEDGVLVAANVITIAGVLGTWRSLRSRNFGSGG